VQRDVERLTLDVPEREVERAERVRLLAAGRVEPGDVCLLPDRFDAERVLPDERAGALLERISGAAFPDAGDADVGFDRHHHVALVEERIEMRRPVDPDTRDLRSGKGGRRIAGTAQPDGGSGRNCSQEGTSIHCCVLGSL